MASAQSDNPFLDMQEDIPGPDKSNGSSQNIRLTEDEDDVKVSIADMTKDSGDVTSVTDSAISLSGISSLNTPTDDKCETPKLQTDKAEESTEESADAGNEQTDNEPEKTCVSDDVDGKREFLEDSKGTATDKSSWKSCDFCRGKATFLCRSCSFLYCQVCFERLHPLIGPFSKHNIVSKNGFFDNGTKVCPKHGLPTKLQCPVCEEKRCTECATTMCALHFKSVFTRQEIQTEKEKMLDALEDVQREVTVLANRVEWEYESIETTAMLRRERIIQEFVSFHDMLYDKEAELLRSLDNEREKKEETVLDQLKTVLSQLEVEEAKLAGDVTAFIQDDDYENFAQKLSTAQNGFKTFQQSKKQFHATWVKCERMRPSSPLLDAPFTMYKEKDRLFTCLNHLIEGRGPTITFTQKTLYIDVDGIIDISQFVKVSHLPPSSYVQFKFELLNKQDVLWQIETDNLEALRMNMNDCICNLPNPSVRLVLRMTPTVVYQTGIISCHQQQLRPSHLILCSTDTIMDTPPEKKGNGLMISPIVTFTKKSLKIDADEDIDIGPLVKVSHLPPSSYVQYKFELLDKLETLWQTDTDNLEAASTNMDDCIRNLTTANVILFLRMTPKVINQTETIPCQQRTSHLIIWRTGTKKGKLPEKKRSKIRRAVRKIRR